MLGAKTSSGGRDPLAPPEEGPYIGKKLESGMKLGLEPAGTHSAPPLPVSTPRTNLLLAWMSQQPLSPICQALESPGRRPKDQGRASTGSSPLDSAGKNGDLQQLVPGPLEPRGLHLPWLPEGTSIPCTPKMTVKPPGAGVL